MAYAIDPFLSPSTSPGDFTLSVEPLTLRVGRPGGATAIIATKAGAEAHTLTLAVTGLPCGAIATFEPKVVDAGRSTRLSIAIPEKASPGVYPVTVHATAANGMTARAYLSLTVDDASTHSGIKVRLAPEESTTQPGFLTQTRVTVSTDEPVELSVDGVPPGTRATFSPARLPVGGGACTLWIFTSPSAAPGAYPIVVSARGAHGRVGEAIFALTITGWDRP
ncbi:COG1470 family protein [Actinokineospora diospyrosa]|uniref:Alpha-galactosidase-like protein n=1 Tax=Actinokineospora diospyrosa TaxID=103728 RepID=A0ABT1IMJ5_9PSEU|nr:hypothetical protein [Actinokineospora diospyrosa]MCP2273754.1 hypothetical protein [Actinokineospora diospyrosa]